MKRRRMFSAPRSAQYRQNHLKLWSVKHARVIRWTGIHPSNEVK